MRRKNERTKVAKANSRGKGAKKLGKWTYRKIELRKTARKGARGGGR